MPLLPPEARLLLAATMPPRPSSDAEIGVLLSAPLDWDLVGRLAEREKLMPVLWKTLRPHADLIPVPIAAAMQRQAAVTEFRMAVSETALRDVVRELSALDSRVMLLKGAALASTVYASFADRPMGDLDILVPGDCAERAWKQLRKMGWSLELSQRAQERLAERERASGGEIYASHHHLPGLLDPGGLGIVVEVHRALFTPSGPFTYDESGVWRDAQVVLLGEQRVSVPSDLHQLLHLCVHFAWSHTLLSGAGRTVRDIATLLDARPIDWDDFVATARRAKAATCAYWSLSLSATLGGAHVPPDVLESLRPRQPRVVTRALERAYVASAFLSACPSLHLARILWERGVLPRASGHGVQRPWDVSERFEEVFALGVRASVGARVAAQVRHLADWLRFSAVLGVPRRVR